MYKLIVDGLLEGIFFFERDSYSEDEPTYIYPDGLKEWLCDGKLHRISGPAVIYPNGRKEWWINGRFQFISPLSQKSETYVRSRI